MDRHDWRAEADWWLRTWGRWMAADKSEIEKMTGWPVSSAGFASGGASSEDTFDHLVEVADIRMIRLIDRAITDLDGQHYAAIMNRYCRSVFRHRGDARAIADEAVERVWKAVRRWV